MEVADLVDSSKQRTESIIDAIGHQNLLAKILKEERNRTLVNY